MTSTTLLRIAIVASVLLPGTHGWALGSTKDFAARSFGRRELCCVGLVLLPTTAACAAEPIPAKTLTEEEMAARVARKEALLRSQGKGKRQNVAVLYSGDYQKGVRGSTAGGFKPDTTPNLRQGDVKFFK